MNKETLYKWAPVWLQNRMISWYGKKLMKQRYGETYHDWLQKYRAKDYSDRASQQREQLTLLKSFLRYAATHSSFYQKRINSAQIDAMTTVAELSQFPETSKEELRQHIEEVYTLPESESIVSFTGGTTGKSLKVRFHPEDFQQRMAYLDAFKYRLGVDPFQDRKATFSGRALLHGNPKNVFWRYNSFYKQRLYSTFHLTEENLPHYIQDLNRFKPHILNGFVSAIYELAAFIDRHDTVLQFTPKAVFTTSETLLPHHRSKIEKVFQTMVYDQYASAEGAPFITECHKGNLHYNLDTGVIETNDANEMIVTSFTTRGTPLIRYNIKDVVHFKEGSCSCGSSHPLVDKISGRKVDYLQSASGKVSLSHLADVIKGIPNSIVKIQFIQSSLEVLKILVVIDASKFKAEHLSKLKKELRYRFGDDMNFDIQEVTDIPREKSGKFALIKNQIPTDATA